MKSLHVVLAFNYHLVQYKGSQQEIDKSDLIFASCHFFLRRNIAQSLQKCLKGFFELSLCLPEERLSELYLFWIKKVQSITLGQT